MLYLLLNKKVKIILTFLFISFIIFSALQPIYSQGAAIDSAKNNLKNAVNWAYTNNTKSVTVTEDTFLIGTMNIINTLLYFIGIVFLLLIIYAGYLWMMARGNEEEIKKASKIFREAVTGLIIILLARIITEFILTQAGGAVNEPDIYK